MKEYLIMDKVIKALNEGTVFRLVTASTLRILAGLSVVGGLIATILLWKEIVDLPAAGILGGIIFQIFFIAAFYVMVHTVYIRSNDILDLGPSDYTVIPILSIVLKMTGEIMAGMQVMMGIGMGMFLWFGVSGSIAREFNPLGDVLPLMIGRGSNAFLFGLVYMISSALFAILTLVFFYFLSEITIVMVDIAKNTKAMTAGQAPRMAMQPPSHPPVYQAAATPVPHPVSVCPNCGSHINPGERFCPDCGGILS